MNIEALRKAEQLAAKVGHVFITIADKNGWPHLASARTMKLMSEGICVK